MIGDGSQYPSQVDNLFNVYDELKAGYPATEQKTVSAGLGVTLNHYGKEDSIAIQNFSEVKDPATPNQGQFKVTDYAIPAVSRSTIDYKIGRTLLFHSTAAGNVLNISYLTPGDKTSAALFNRILDGLYKLQASIGTLGSGANLDIGTYSTLGKWLTFFFQSFTRHTHSGGTQTGATLQLDGGSIQPNVISNGHIASNANIDQTKLNLGILSNGIAFIPTGANKYVDITTTAWAASNHILEITRGAYGYTDPGDIGVISYKEELTGQTGFRVQFLSSVSSLATRIPFTWILR